MSYALEKYNFGPNFLHWINVLYNKPSFVIKNNGWLSQNVSMSRGIRQGCPISALLFILSTEIMNVQIRDCPNVKGVDIYGNIKKVFAYADDTTLTLADKSSISAALNIVDEFGKFSGLTLNRDKCEGVWLGKNRNIHAVYENIIFTDEPIKGMGIYFGHNTESLYDLNWGRKLRNLEKLLNSWKSRKLTVFGKVVIIKSLVVSKLLYNFNILETNKDVIKKVESMIYAFLWGKKERIKRKTLIGTYTDGGICMPDIELIALSVKAKWLTKLYEMDSWRNYNLSYYILEAYLSKVGLNVHTLLKCYFTCEKEVETLNIPMFYKEIFTAFNKCKFEKTVDIMNDHDFLSQIIWCNKLFKFKEKCLMFKNWSKSGILYVKDIFNEQGLLLSANELCDKLNVKTNWISEYKIIAKVMKSYITKYVFDYSYCKYINIHIDNTPLLLDGKRRIILSNISTGRQKFFYQLLVKKKFCRPYVEKQWQKEFKFHIDRLMWESIHLRISRSMVDRKLCEFRYKLLHNLLICNEKLFKWKMSVSNGCLYCNAIETTKHQLFECVVKSNIWKIVSLLLSVDITWKHLVLGFDESNVIGKTRNYLCCIISSA